MFEFHKDKARYFNYQHWTTRDFILPFMSGAVDFSKKLEVLEIGCAEAGVLKAFVERGDDCVGIELLDYRLEYAREFLKASLEKGQIRFINKNIYEIDIERDLGNRFDVILLKDVIEHIPDQERLIPKLREFLNADGRIFFGFPPWYMPFGGHQQICQSKFLRALPWFHLLPKGIYKWMLKTFGESDYTITDLTDVKATGISIERFERIVRKSGFRILKKKFFLTNPIYKYKFGWQPVEQFRVLSAIPFLRNFYTTGVYYLIG